MSITIILIVAIVLTLIFHFIGVYADAKKTVWVMLAIVWAACVNIAMSEIKPSGYTDVESMSKNCKEIIPLVDNAMPSISIYEMLEIKKTFHQHCNQE